MKGTVRVIGASLALLAGLQLELRSCRGFNPANRFGRLRGSRAWVFSISLAIALLSAGATHAEAVQHSESTPAEAGQSQPQAAGIAASSLGAYRRILVSPVDLFYTAKFDEDAKKQRYKIGSKDLERIRRYFVEAVEKKLANSYPIATEPGPDVLRIDPVLVDAVVDKRAWLAPGRDAFKKRDELLLVVVLRDSQSGAILHRVLVDARPRGGGARQQGALSYWNDMRHLLRLLTTRVRWAMEAEPQSSSIASIAPSRDPEQRPVVPPSLQAQTGPRTPDVQPQSVSRASELTLSASSATSRRAGSGAQR